MEKLSNPQVTIATIKKYDFAFQKKFGQNFLIDEHVLNKIIGAAGVTKDDMVLEIGPGFGTLTQYLAESAREVVAVEIDKALIPVLNETLADYDNVTVINDDILKVDIEGLVNERNDGKPVKVVANLPYYITTPIIMGLLENHVPVDNITVMVQKEVAERMQAGPGTKDYGALSLAVQYYAKPYIAANVPPNCFIPRPNVGSAVIRLELFDAPPVKVIDERLMFQMIRASFNQRRKTLQNSIVNGGVSVTKDRIVAALKRMELSETIRGEALTLSQFAELANLLSEERDS
ncbi:MAG: 16S rRNA (adenine(1518)-N(6)/adenine(1519)-N(6))-dimethyltransferase RsmA [Lachnospiraceae bacterium]|nr:16S rRNA (adenine(1518)-N(6)/adenine(1519)-N(6))-dimethyltransferase RsmA [Lachnospiraceae bacterium]